MIREAHAMPTDRFERIRQAGSRTTPLTAQELTCTTPTRQIMAESGHVEPCVVNR